MDGRVWEGKQEKKEITMPEARPLRSVQEKITERVPQGPRKIVGKGNLVGAAGFAGITFAETFSPLPLGFTIRSSEVVRETNGTGVQRFEVWAISKDIAEFAARREAAGPNLNFFADVTDVTNTEVLRKRSGHSLWEITVQVDRREER